MSVVSFIPTVWAVSTLRNLEKASIFGSLLNRDYEGELKFGNVVKIPTVDPVSVKTYEKGTPIEYDAITGSTQDLTISQQKYFALKTEDVEVTQSRPAFLNAATQNAAYSLRDTIDLYCATILAEGVQNIIGTKAAPESIATAANGKIQPIVMLLSKMAQKLTEKNVPLNGRWVVLTPYAYNMLTLAGIAIATNNDTIISEGYIGRALGFNIFVSPNVPTEDGASLIMAGTNAAGSLCMQIEKTETLRSEKQFGDLVRGLAVYGAACTMPDALIGAYVENE
jgi:hypothetical protein